MRRTTRHGLLAAAVPAAMVVSLASLAGCSAQPGQTAPEGQGETQPADASDKDTAASKAADRAGDAEKTKEAEGPEPTEDADTVETRDEQEADAEQDGQDARSELARLLDRHKVSSVLLLGDSITAGFGCDGYSWYDTGGKVIYDGPEGVYHETSSDVKCWANDMREYMARRGVSDFTNAAVSGAKMWWLSRSPDSWLGNGADAIVVMLGTNDAVYSSPDQFETDAEKGLSEAASHCKCLVVLSPPDNDRTDEDNLYDISVIDERLRTVCERHGWCHVSLFESLDEEAGDLDEDMCHPTTQGSHRMWEQVKEELGL